MNKILIGIKPDTVEGINNDLKLLVNIILPQIRHVLKIEVDNFIILNNGKINPQILASSNLISHLYFGNKNRHSCIKNYSNRNWIFFRVKTSLTFAEINKLKPKLRKELKKYAIKSEHPADNCIHISDSAESAEREILLFKNYSK